MVCISSSPRYETNNNCPLYLVIRAIGNTSSLTLTCCTHSPSYQYDCLWIHFVYMFVIISTNFVRKVALQLSKNFSSTVANCIHLICYCSNSLYHCSHPFLVL